MDNHTLALCIPAYNAANYLPRLLSSAHNQLIPFDEILVYNDCSTDNTAHIAEKFGATVIQGDVNRGCSYGKNALAEYTKCSWIHFHDADDELLPNFTRLAHKWISLPEPPDVVLFDYEHRDNETNKLYYVRKFNRQQLEQDAISYTIREQINPFCGLYKKDKFLKAGGYDVDPLILYNEDVAMHCRLAVAGLSFSAESEISIINYRVGNSMSSANQLKCIVAHYHVLRKNAQAVGHKYPKEIAGKLWSAAGVAASLSDYSTADNCVKLAVELNGTLPYQSSLLFQLLCIINPYFAVRKREQLIRIFKPRLRK